MFVIDIQSPEAKTVKLALGDFATHVADMKPFLRDVITALEEHTKEVFDSEGAKGSRKWKPRTQVSKIIRQHMGSDPNGPLLVETGRLREALTNSNNGFALRSISDRGFVFGTTGIPYADYHQFGTKQKGVQKKQQMFLGMTFGVWMKKGHIVTMPARKPIDIIKNGRINAQLRQRIVDAARKHIVEARRKAANLPVAWDKIIESDFAMGIDHAR